MRGKVLDGYKDNPYYRITPAYAGKRASGFSLNLYIQDHPRLCGEKTPYWYLVFTPLGSPPPMRGKVPMSQVYEDMRGITPAYAGKSTAGTSPRC